MEQIRMKDIAIRVAWWLVALFIIWEIVTAVASKQ